MKRQSWVSRQQHPTLAVSLVAILLAILLPGCTGGQTGLNVGDEAPSFSLTGSSGETVALSDYVGVKPVLLYFHMAVG